MLQFFTEWPSSLHFKADVVDSSRQSFSVLAELCFSGLDELFSMIVAGAIICENSWMEVQERVEFPKEAIVSCILMTGNYFRAQVLG